jgi:MFS family permease
LVGIGSGILLYVLSPILPEYFPDRSGLAQGTMFAGEWLSPRPFERSLTATAAALGGMVFSFMTTALLDHVRARWTLGIVAIFSCVTLSIASALALPPRKFEKRDTCIIGLRTFKEPLFACLFLANLIHPLTLAVPMTFGPLFAEALGMNFTHASYMLAVNSGVGIPARLGTGALADKIGHQNTLILATAVYALATWVFWLIAAETGNVGLWISMSVFHGLVSGVFNIVMNSAQKQLFGDEMYYPKNGAMTSIRGFGYVVGVPIVGALMGSVAGKNLHGSDFTKVIVYVGSLLMISLVCLLNVRRLDARQTGWKWAR